MACWYLWVRALQDPFDLGVDANARAWYAFNVIARKAYSAQFADELLKILQNAGVGTTNTNMFAGSGAHIPTAAGPYLAVVETGGPGPLKTQNTAGIRYQQPTAQVSVRAASAASAKTMIYAAYNALVVVKNQTITV